MLKLDLMQEHAIKSGPQNELVRAKNPYMPQLVTLTSLFFMWGFITVLNDILIPHLKALFDMNYTKTMLIQFTFFGAYFIMSVPSGWIIGRTGYKKGIVIGLLTTGLGAFLFYPASELVSYNVFLLAFFVLASGITILQVAANPYVAVLGRPETASGRLNMTQAFNSLGTTIAPVFGSVLILSAVSGNMLEEAKKVQGPYIGIALFLILIAVVFLFVKMPKVAEEQSAINGGSAWQYRHLVLGALAIFLYVGAEVAIGSFMINFIAEPYIAGYPEKEAAKYVALYWGGAMIGRFLGAISLSGINNKRKEYLLFAVIMVFAFGLAYYLTRETALAAVFLIFVAINMGAFMWGNKIPNRTLAIFAALVLLLVSITILFTGKVAMWSIVSVGLFNSIMFPTIFTLAIKDLGKHTSQGSGILCAAIVGGAIIPLLMGALADRFGIQNSYIITLVSYAYILFYGMRGYRVKSMSAS